MRKIMRSDTGPIGWDSLIATVEMAYHRGAWHGKNLRSALQGIDAATAHRQVPERSKTIWQIALHCAYWCYRVRVSISGQGNRSFPRKGSDWLEQPVTPDPALWKADLALIGTEYEQLLETLADMRDGKLEPVVGTDELEYLVSGAAFHAIYHASQITQFKLLLENR